MRILMLGAGAVGGYFGGRMVAAGSDLTFLVREPRAAQLAHGLQIESPHGNATIPVNTITGLVPGTHFDVVIVSCKAYGLNGALDAIEPYVSPGTKILPLLNGVGHIERLERRFPDAVVWGGTAGIIATMTAEGAIRQMHPNQFITAGTRSNQATSQSQLEALIGEMVRADINAVASSAIEVALWDKWTFLATLAAATCLMRGSIGQILTTNHGETLMSGLFEECLATARAEGYPPSDTPAQDYRGVLFERDSSVTASMLRDMESGGPTEAEHIIGDMIARAMRHGIATPYLDIAYSRMQLYETHRDS